MLDYGYDGQHACKETNVYSELDAPSNDVIAMNLTIAAIDRWLENSSDDKSGQELGREIGAMYREIHNVVASISPGDDDEEDEEDEDDELAVNAAHGIAV
jgi:hypothetical protein